MASSACSVGYGFDKRPRCCGARGRQRAAGEKTTYGQSSLPLGIGTVFQVGKFYELPQIEFFYHRDRIDGDMVFLSLVESYQLGKLIQAEVFTKIEKSGLVCAGIR